MNHILNQALDNFVSATGAALKEEQSANKFIFDLPDGKGSVAMYTLFPGIYLSYYNINTFSLPDSDEGSGLRRFQFNYCMNGRIELSLEDGTYIYLKEHDFCITEQLSKNESIFPTGLYEGIALTLDIDFMSSFNPFLFSTFEIDFTSIQKLYSTEDKTYISEAGEELSAIVNRLWLLYSDPSFFYMQIHSLEILYLLSHKKICAAKSCTFYTNIQVALAKKAEQILVSNMCSHIPIRLLAEQFSVSETSLKNYFKGVYGQNISDYLRNLRMETAAKLLFETRLPISEISRQVGYNKPGKFSAIFKKYYKMSPLEYRRNKSLEASENFCIEIPLK
ncbi:MAG: AraC family transcriptional regulator [Muricomes sp.]